MMEFEETEAPPTPEQIRAFEARFGVTLPEEFKAHYLRFNGGYPPLRYVKGVRHIFTVNSFFPMTHGRVPIEILIENYRQSGTTFGQRIPFACDDGGNIFLISAASEGYGEVVIIAEAEASIGSEHEATIVARSFREFLDGFLEDA